MTDNNEISTVKSLLIDNQLVDVNTMHSLQKVSEEIQQVMDVVDSYKRKVDSLQPPIVDGEPWYKFAFGKASVTAVNKVMESFSTFVQDTFKMVALTQNLQNENDMNICRLIGLLAMAEANSYEKLNGLASDLKDLSTEDEKSARQLKELEKSFLQSLDDSEIDSTKKEEQMSRIIDYVTLFAENKTKKIRSISLSLSEIKAKLDKYCTKQDNWIVDTKEKITFWQEEVNDSLEETKRLLHENLCNIIKVKLDQLDDSLIQMKKSLAEYTAKQEEKINIELKSQKEKIETSSKAVEEKILEYKSVIKNQTITILEQNELIKKQNEKILSLRKKNNLAIFMGFILYILMFSVILFVVTR